VGNPVAFFKKSQEIKRLLPLLYRRLLLNEVPVEKAFMRRLRAAMAYEELRGQTYQRHARSALTALMEAEVPFLLLKGAALVGTVYGEWSLRHCHNVDLWIPAPYWVAASHALRKAGFSSLRTAWDSRGMVVFVHDSGLPLALRNRLFPIDYYRPPMEELVGRARLCEIAGVPVRVLAPADTLLHVCGHAACSPGRDTLRWACDAYQVLKHHPSLDWDALLETARRGRLALPLRAMFGYLTESLDAPIPHAVMQRLAESVETSLLACEAALSCLSAGRRGSLLQLFQAANRIPARLVLFKWMVIPSPSCLRWRYAPHPGWTLPLVYLVRPLRYLTRRLTARGKV
jgi:hypothetical protein